MNQNFDELTKGLAQSATRRAALKKFGLGLAGIALACFGLANKAKAATYQRSCEVVSVCCPAGERFSGRCVFYDSDMNLCIGAASPDCPAGKVAKGVKDGPCGRYKQQCSFTI